MTAPDAYIVIQGPGHEGTTLPLREGITSLGRLPSNDVILLGDLVSRHHSRLLFFDGRASVQDMGSHNGTWVNGERVSTKPLEPSDVVRVGNFRVGFHIGKPDTTSPPPPQRDASLLAGETMPPGPLAFQTDDILPETVQHRDASRSAVLEQFSHGRASDPSNRWQLLFQVNHLLVECPDVPRYLARVSELMVEYTDAAVVAFYRQLPGAAEPELVVAGGHSVDGGVGPQVSVSVLRWTIAKNFTVFSKDLTKDVRFTGASAMVMSDEMRAMVCAPLSTTDGAVGALYVSRAAVVPFSEEDVDTIEAMAHLAAGGVQLLERDLGGGGDVARTLGSVCAPQVVQRLVDDGVPRGLDARTVTVCACDIQGFTSVMERLTPPQVADLLAAYWDRMAAVIFKHHGRISLRDGDKITALFGAPYSTGNDPVEAVRAATEMRRAFDQFVASRPAVGPRRLRLGIETGWLLTGFIGAATELAHTAVGEALELARKIQSSAVPGSIMVGEATAPTLQGQFSLTEAGVLKIRGRADTLTVYEVGTGSTRPHAST